LAMKHGVKAIGTVSHQWTTGVSVMEGLRHANRHALRAWNKVYKGRLGVALTDTFGTEAFWEDFDPELSRLYDGVRQDSGDPVAFTHRTMKHYESVGVWSPKKDISYSNGLTAIGSRELANRFDRQIGQVFCIGTHLSNDVPGSPALNIVIKMRRCNGVEVVKLGDGEGKVTGDRDAVRVVRYVFFRTPLDDAS
jgi:nicotinate phosphoribosyltransferase